MINDMIYHKQKINTNNLISKSNYRSNHNDVDKNDQFLPVLGHHIGTVLNVFFCKKYNQYLFLFLPILSFYDMFQIYVILVCRPVCIKFRRTVPVPPEYYSFLLLLQKENCNNYFFLTFPKKIYHCVSIHHLSTFCTTILNSIFLHILHIRILQFIIFQYNRPVQIRLS